ncbi:hypothetical protein SAMN02745704_02745 [Paucidesulfovibrio gracilis DSM 16080]|uniref:Uncharacterized protein n=1 Tax=Paucidesulfovibrio gracilis DSM 16080 TaxID=1121449 RepID=A0A1T4Y431_9BACT|nr:hypothetical protein [Paucidesulfovibrio gracilis]SKA96562.1 hypothetical protein SAMN02745704_02745 [Paucidesulfovibrio gracilis DSM 16080]
MEHTSSRHVEDVRNLIYELALTACRKQVLVFSKELKQKMVSMGMERSVIEDVIRTAFQGYSSMEVFKRESSERMLSILDAYLRPSNRGFDPMGRLLIEFGLMRPFKKPVLYPDDSRQDEAARKVFTKGVIPRPLVRYFLVSVRGSIPGLDGFTAKPVMFSEHNEAMQERREDLGSLVEEYTVEFNFGKTTTDWRRMLEDPRVHSITRDFFSDLLENMRALGPQRVLKIVNNMQNSDKDPGDRTRMKRPFELADIKQLMVALDRGFQSLEKRMASRTGA